MKASTKFLILDWLAGLGAVIIAAFILFLALTGIQAMPAVEGDTHFRYIADLCPHLPEDEQDTCIAWLRNGGRHE